VKSLAAIDQARQEDSRAEAGVDQAAPHPVFASGSAGNAIRTASKAQALADGLRRRGGASARKSQAARELRRAIPVDDSFILQAEQSLERRIRAHLAKGMLAVTLTDNRYTMISVRRESDGPSYRVRLHHMFADAEPVITRALAKYIGRNCSKASRLLGDFIDENQHRVRPAARRVVGPSIATVGDVHDLQDIYDDLNERYFGGSIRATITWGQRCGKPRRRNSIKMGSYSVEDRLIRIHRSLDREFVPAFFIAWIVYHEMLHQVHGAPIVNGRRQFHTKAFLEDEARYEDYASARAWEREHLDDLLTY
jgi:hypothetical protein